MPTNMILVMEITWLSPASIKWGNVLLLRRDEEQIIQIVTENKFKIVLEIYLTGIKQVDGKKSYC